MVDRTACWSVESLCRARRGPTQEMLRDVEGIVVDLQDVGTRIYTFVYTLANCMRAAKKFGKKVIACDRPNPIGGAKVAGVVLDPACASFVGQFPIATRHGMTFCELGKMFNEHFELGCEAEY